jgi:hypothetical protein
MTLSRAQLAFVTAGCAAGVLIALIGAAQAVDTPADPHPVVEKADRVPGPYPGAPSITVEEVNVHIGVSNLIRVEGVGAEP